MAFPLKLDQLCFTKYAAESMVYLERHKLLEIITQVFAELSIIRPESPDKIRNWIGKNITRIADTIYKNCLSISFEGGGDCSFFQLPRRFHHRIVVYGRRGSGRRSQAQNLAKQFNLVYIDGNILVHQGLHSTDDLGKAVQDAFDKDDLTAKSNAVSKIVSRRFLQPDCLQKGWVIVNFPYNLEQIKELFEQFTIPPNRFVYLDCPEKIAMQRAISQPDLGCQQDVVRYLEREMEYFNSHKAEMIDYMRRRHEVVTIDASPRYEIVRISVLTKTQKTPYVLGFKQ